MEIWSYIIIGFQQILQPINLLYCFTGVTLGTLIGVLPGIGPVATMSLLLPLTMKTSPLASIIMLAGVYYGAMYGGSTTSILINIPGEAASVVTLLDGHQMAKRGRAGPALGISAFGSFIGGTFSIIALMLIAKPLSRLAIVFGPPEYFALLTLGITMVIYLSTKSFLKGLVMGVVGLIIGCVGTDLVSGKIRFAYGIMQFYDGIDIVPMIMGLFGISEVLTNIGEEDKRITYKPRVKNLLPNLQDWKKSLLPISRGSILGFLLGVIPGGGAVLSSFISYSVEKKVSKHPEEFGRGAIEGVAGPETANNSAVGAAFIPLFTLGIPSNVIMAILLANFSIHGVSPGPGFIDKNPELFWGIICSMYLGNAMLLLLNLPLIGIWVKILDIPYRVLFPLILLFCVIGVYSINYRALDIMTMVAFGLLGYFLKRFGYELVPLIMAFILGAMFESSFRQTMIIGSGKVGFLFTKPIAVVSFSITLLVIISSFSNITKNLRKKAI